MADLFDAAGYAEERIAFDPSVVRGLEYYTGPVFEAELLFETTDEDGRQVRFGSVGGGGRYDDDLVARFRGESVPATGFSMGVSRLYSALQHLGRTEAEDVPAPVVVLVMDRERTGDYHAMAAKLRDAGIRAEMYLGTSGNEGADEVCRQARCPGPSSSRVRTNGLRGEVQIKDMAEGSRVAADIASREEYREARPAQFSVAEAELVNAVRDVLARSG